MSYIEGLSIVIVGLIVGFLFFGMFLHKKKLSKAFEAAQAESKKILEDARREADQMVRSAIKEAKEESRRRRRQLEEDAKRRKGEFQKSEKKLRQREQTIESKQSSIESRERKAVEREKKLIQDETRQLKLIAECELAIDRNQKTLERVANMSAEQARRELMKSLEEEARKNAQTSIREIEAQARQDARRKAMDIVSLSVQRLASEYVNDSTITVVTLPSEEMKGRIIGREGRNIRALEQATGVDLIIDDTPEAVIVSCFNPIRREIAKITLDRLIADGRIHPARIEETAKRVEEEFDTIIKEYGEQAAFDTGITDLHPELIHHLGRLRFRATGTQSVLQHAVETAHICGMMAGELGMNVKKAKRGGLLHDIGKAVSHESDGHHADLGADLCSRFDEHPDVVKAVRLHHAEDLVDASSLAVIVGAANSLSSNRPGARKELVESYIKRLEDMESIIKNYPGIDDAYVLQAGREVRAMVTPDDVTDGDVRDLSDNIALKLRQELTFPGQVRITVLRESKYVEYAT